MDADCRLTTEADVRLTFIVFVFAIILILLAVVSTGPDPVARIHVWKLEQ